jgi:hypothetical protein
MPNTRPIVTAAMAQMSMVCQVTATNTSAALRARIRLVARAAPASPTPMPRALPRLVIATASARNCASTSRWRAPAALGIPISRVRSATEASRTFMMPMPPTISDIAANAPIRSGRRDQAAH